MRRATFILVMGVAGSGKTTIGMQLADALNREDGRWRFLDADDYHPPSNIAKMSAGLPLDDADRAPWLADLRVQIGECLRNGERVVLACSALKARYRAVLIAEPARTAIIYLCGGRGMLAGRLEARRGHFMKASMLDSQLSALEEPTADEAAQVIECDLAQPSDAIVARTLCILQTSS